MSFQGEFQTVELIERSDAETRGVDAFALSLLKAERQLRRLFTYLVFQYPCFPTCLSTWRITDASNTFPMLKDMETSLQNSQLNSHRSAPNHELQQMLACHAGCLGGRGRRAALRLSLSLFSLGR
jgi:hypothetical protein